MALARSRSLHDDPVAFAEDLYGTMGAADDPRLLTHAPRRYAAFKAASRALRDALEARGEAVPYDRPAALVDDRAMAWATDAFIDGVRFEIAADQLRGSLLATHDDAPCPDRFGWGTFAGARCERREGDGIATVAVAAG